MNQEIAVVNGSEIRVLREGENLLFVAKDIVEGVGAVWKGVTSSIDHIPHDFRGVRSVQTPPPPPTFQGAESVTTPPF